MSEFINLNELKENDKLFYEKLKFHENLYIPYEKKLELSKIITDECMMFSESGYCYCDYNRKRIVTYLLEISIYTNIVIDEFTVENYDFIRSRLGDIKDLFVDDLKDIDDFENVLDDQIYMYLNMNNFEKTIKDSQAKLFVLAEDMVSHINTMLDKGDPNKIAKYLSKGFEVLANKMPDFSNVESINKYTEVFKNAKK